jgi:rubrerythrin
MTTYTLRCRTSLFGRTHTLAQHASSAAEAIAQLAQRFPGATAIEVLQEQDEPAGPSCTVPVIWTCGVCQHQHRAQAMTFAGRIVQRMVTECPQCGLTNHTAERS